MSVTIQEHKKNRQSYDLLIIGGGINGTAVARDAAGRGLSVCLCEKDDLANHTSSASTKLIHGGLRYLEQYEFKLVRASLKEREVLLRAAPHIIWPLRFVLPYDRGLRPKWMLRAGLFLYDSLGGREILPGTKTVNLSTAPHKNTLDSRLKTGFEYSDCWVEDARLVVLNAVDAAENGAEIRTRTEITNLRAEGEGYRAGWRHTDGESGEVFAKAVVNAAGPWVEHVLSKVKQGRNSSSLRLVKGSHIITKRLFEGDHAYIFQNADKRIIFAIPYEGEFTLIGTTDVPFTAGDEVKATDEEISYLCDAANEYFQHKIKPKDVVRTYSGVRPLYDDQSSEASEVTRDYVLNLDLSEQGAPFLSVYGGKITTSRKLAEHVLEKLQPHAPRAGAPWTRNAAFPGGDIANADFESFVNKSAQRYPTVKPAMLRRLCRAYDTRIDKVFEQCPPEGSITGRIFGAQLCEAEARYLIRFEWARTVEDILWRRSKLGLHLNANETKEFENWFKHSISNITAHLT